MVDDVHSCNTLLLTFCYSCQLIRGHIALITFTLWLQAKSQQTMEALLQALQEQLQIAVGEALEANKEAVSAMVAQQCVRLQGAWSFFMAAGRIRGYASVPDTAAVLPGPGWPTWKRL